MKLKSSSNDSLIDISLRRFNTVALVVEDSIEKVGYSTSIEVSFRINKIVAFRFAISVVLRIS